MNENLTKDLPPDGVKLILAQLGSMDARLTGMDTRLVEIETRLTNLEERVDRRLNETRPIWEQVLERLDKIETQQAGFDQKLTGFDQKLAGFDQKLTTLDTAINNLGLDMRAGFKRLERQMAQLASDVVGLRTDQSDLERRMDRLEDKVDAIPQADKTPN